MIEATCIDYTADRRFQVWRLTSPADLIFITADNALVGRNGGLTATAAVKRCFYRALGKDKQLVQVLRTPLFWADGWQGMERTEGAAFLLASRIYVFQAEELNPNEWVLNNTPDDATTEDIIESAEGVMELSLPKVFAQELSGQHDRPGIPSYDGVLRHPVHGDSLSWLIEFDEELPEPSPDYPHLHALFSAFELDPASHAAVYTYLLGMFHHWSLSYPRPILLVDSWMQGRGKSEVCQAIARLIDNEDSGTSLPDDKDGCRDEVVAHFLSRRSLYIDNVDGVADWNQKLIDTIATGDGAVRAKYSRKVDHIRGAAVAINTIFGTSTFHPDLIDRFIRVELPGEAVRLDPQPKFFARDFRLELIAEILLAHESARPLPMGTSAHQSRFQHFEHAGALAYEAVFGVDYDVVQERLFESRQSARSFLTPVARHLYSHHPERFLVPNDKIFRDTFPSKLAPRHEGARALGMTLRKGAWI